LNAGGVCDQPTAPWNAKAAKAAKKSYPHALVLCWVILSSTGCVRPSRLPVAISDQEFWSLIEALSEPAGTFSLSDNFVSNEPHFAENVRWLGPTGGVYIGVGPEQNFSYIARLPVAPGAANADRRPAAVGCWRRVRRAVCFLSKHDRSWSDARWSDA